MKEIKILHLFPHLLSLYGEYGNLAMLKAELEQAGHTVTVTCYEAGEPDLQQDLIYIGSGTEDNLLVALQRLAPYADAIEESVEAGTPWLATGNAMTLFGKTVTRREQTVPALGVFEYITEIDDSQRYLGDALSDDRFAGAPSLGFINTCNRYLGIETPLLQLRLGAKLGNDKTSAADGIREQNFFGTQLIGPFLTKNPHILSFFVNLLTGTDHTCPPDSMIQKAYAVSASELAKRLNGK